MMTFDTWSLFALAILAASISPGPNVLIVNTVRYGFRGAFFTILGNLTALFFVASLAALGVGTLIKTMPIAYIMMKWVGGAYLIWMGYKLIASSFMLTSSQAKPIEHHQTNPRSSAVYSQAIAVSLSNPKSILFLSAVFPQFLSTDQAIIPQFAVMFASIIFVVALVHGIYAWSSLWLKDKPLGQSTRKWLARLTGGAFIGLGSAVAFNE